MIEKKTMVAVFGVFAFLFPKWLFAEENILYPHVLHPPSHHIMSQGTVILATLLLPIDCGSASGGPMVSRITEPVYNDIPGWGNEVILPAGTRLEGTYACYRGTTALLSFDRFSSDGPRPLSIRCGYSAPHTCTKTIEGNIGHRIRVSRGFEVRLYIDRALWLPDSQ